VLGVYKYAVGAKVIHPLSTTSCLLLCFVFFGRIIFFIFFY